MPTAGPNNAGTGADDATVGTITWGTTSNITTSDNTYAPASIGSTGTSHYLKATNFGFSIPSNATVQGIQVTFERQSSSGGSGSTAVDNSVKIVKGGTITGSEKSTGAQWSNNVDQNDSFGSTSDLWGTTWTASDINSSTFGVVVSGKPRVGFEDASTVLKVDTVTITITYSLPAGGGPQIIFSD